MKPNLPDLSARPSPGRIFAEACTKTGTSTSVDFDYTITDSLLSSRRKPRVPVRNMFKSINLFERPATYYWYETAPSKDDAEQVHEAQLRPEAAHGFHKAPIPELYPTTAWVQVPPELLEDVDSFEHFINYRLIIRLCTAENQALTRGPGGLLNIPGIETIKSKGVFSSPLLAACNEVEQEGGTADGMIINPIDYYRLLGSGRLIHEMEDNGVLIVRTRMVDPGRPIVGDFGHGALLFDSGRSVMRFTDPPPGTFAQPGVALMAEIRERVGLNLPTNFYHVALD